MSGGAIRRFSRFSRVREESIVASRFIEKVTVDLKAGDGGNGCVAFRRENYVPRCGPNGGDGGDGGNVILKVDPGMNTLYDFRYRPRLTAKNGQDGMGDLRSGKKGEDLIVRVPQGTTVRMLRQRIIADLTGLGAEAVVAEEAKAAGERASPLPPIGRGDLKKVLRVRKDDRAGS